MRRSASPLRRCFLRARGEHGSALFETALSAMLLLVVIFGIIEMGLALYTYHSVSEAAREATRYAIVRGSASCADSTPDCNASKADIQNYVATLGFLGVNSTALTVTPTWPGTGATCTPSKTPCNNPGNLVQVTVQYKLPVTIPFFPANTFTMSSTSEMVISQ